MRDLKIIALILYLTLCRLFLTFCQDGDYSWWNETHNWDGITHWSKYIIMSPGFLGPNALPIPYVKEGRVGESSKMKFEVSQAKMDGDNTQSLWLEFYHPIVKNKVAIELKYLPYEHYKMSEKIRDERYARGWTGEGTSVGDLYFGTIIQLIKNKKFPDVTLGLYCRTASGDNIADARMTDSPGYYFDLTFGKNIKTRNEKLKWRLSGMAGFYCWQTNYNNSSEGYFQNDAILLGVASGMIFSDWLFNNSLSGYLGYIGNRDKPVVFRSEIGKKIKSLQFSSEFETGVNEWLYNSLKIKVIYLF